MAKLVINSGTPEAREFELKPGTNFVGRGFANDFQIEDPSVSSSHLQIMMDGSSVSIKDLGSTNGTFINRQPVTDGILQPGHLLRLGGVEMIFEGDGAPATTATASLGAALPPIGSAQIKTPPIPPPVPMPPPPNRAKTGLTTTSGTAVLARTAAPPIAEPEPAVAAAPAREMVELPDGKSACKFHPKNPAQWLCEKCGNPFCSLCVTNRQTPEGTGYFCRKCGVECLPVKVKYAASKEKAVKEYSDVMVLVRSVGFGFGGAILSAILWVGVGLLMAQIGLRFFVPVGLLCWATGGLCGYAVKIACQDRPGIIFSLIAVGFCLLGAFIGDVAMALTSGMGAFGIYSLLGLLFGMFTAWKIGGGDF